MRSAAATGLRQAGDFRIERPSGPPCWAHADISCLDDSQEVLTGFRLTLTDITARIQAEEALEEQREAALKLMQEAVKSRMKAEQFSAELRESEERFRTLANNIYQLAWMADMNGGRFWYNQRWLDYTGMPLEDAQGWGWTKVHHPDHIDRVVKGIRRARDKGEPWEDTYPLRSKSGEYRWFLSRAVPIRDHEGKIVHWFGTNTDVTEREQQMFEEQRLREIAEAHNRAKDEFLSILSHELRTPLNAILGYSQMTLAKPHNTSAVTRNSEIIQRSARSQLKLIEDLLDTSRIISGKLKLDIAHADVRQVLEEAVEIVRPSAAIKRIDLKLEIDEAPRNMLCDATRLRQAVWNLLQNAIKFTPEGGLVALRVERIGRRLRLIISDTGSGIEPEFLPAVFDRFSQTDMSRTRRHGGLGLGLALVKQLVELHGGTIEASSEGAGQGATFTVTLPINTSQVASQQQQAIAEIGDGPADIPPEDLPRLDGLRTLVVDDQEEARVMIAETLCERGAAVTMAASGREALELFEGSTFDALVCDISMPEMDGYELMRRLRVMAAAHGGSLPAIALTALARPEDRLQALRAGFLVHVVKPVKLAELVIVLAGVVQWGHTEQS